MKEPKSDSQCEVQPPTGLTGLRQSLSRLPGVFARRAWKLVPPALLATRPFRRCGREIHKIVSRRQRASQGYHCECNFTRFLRNIPLLEVLRDLAAEKPAGARLRIASVGCSTGAEIYSLLWIIRSGALTGERVHVSG